MHLLVTGGAGFIGSNFVRYWVEQHPDDTVVAYDVLTYAGNRPNLADVEDRIASSRATSATSIAAEPPARATTIDTVVHFAAESHNSLAILDPGRFFRTNVLGTQTMLEAARRAGVCALPPHLDLRGLRRPAPRHRRGLHRGPPLPAPDPLQRLEGGGRPRRAGLRRDLRAAGHHHQLLQQLRPLPVPREGHPAVHRAGARRPAPAAVRVDPEPARVAPRRSTTAGPSRPSSSGAGSARPTTSAAASRRASRRSPTPCSTPSASPQSLKKIVPDRPGHDRRYLLDCTKITKELGWEPTIGFDEGLAETVRWYAEQPRLVGAAAGPGPGGRVLVGSGPRRTVAAARCLSAAG